MIPTEMRITMYLKMGKFGSLMNMGTRDQNLILYLDVIHTLHMIHEYQVTQIPMK